jgi:hypothetical protein
VKKHVLWLALLVAAFVAATAYMLRSRPDPDSAYRPPVSTAADFAPPLNQVAPEKPRFVLPATGEMKSSVAPASIVTAAPLPNQAALRESLRETSAELLRQSLPPAPPVERKSDTK